MAFLVRNCEGAPMVLAREVTVEPATGVDGTERPGIWTFIGFITDGKAERLAPGLEFEWHLWDRPEGSRGAERVRVAKVNPVTVRLEALSDGTLHDIRVDR